MFGQHVIHDETYRAVVETILIVGGAGAVGRRLESAFRGRRVVILDRVPPDTASDGYWSCDLLDTKQLGAMSKKVDSPCAVIYLAAEVSNPSGAEAIRRVIDNNVSALVNFLHAFRETTSHLTFVSSVSVYGRQAQLPITEGQCLNPSSVYGASKAAAEHFARVVCERLEISLTIVRPTQLFGVESAVETLPYRLVESLRSRRPLELTCDPTILRDYLNADDLVDLLARVIDDPKGGIFNAGCGRALPVAELFRLAYEAFGIPFSLDDVTNGPPDNSFSVSLDNRRAAEAFGFAPSRPVETWFQEMAAESEPPTA